MPLASASCRSARPMRRMTGCVGRVPAPTRMFEYAMRYLPGPAAPTVSRLRRTQLFGRLENASRHEPLVEIITPLHGSFRSQLRAPVQISVSFSFPPEAAGNNAHERPLAHIRSVCGPGFARAARSQEDVIQILRGLVP